MDPSFKSDFLTVNNVRLHYLDWGGTGESLLLLAGFGDNVGVFDGFAQKFFDRFHVIGLTRRGFGESDKPPTGYDVATRVKDIRCFMDTLEIEKTTIIGHSMAGDEMTLFSSLHPDRINKLIYLDAAYDRRPTADLTLSDPTTEPYFKRLVLEVLESPLAAEIILSEMPPLDEWERNKAISKAMFTFQPDYKQIKAPSLAFYAVTLHHPSISPDTPEETRRHLDNWWQENVVPYVQASIAQFRREAWNSEVVELKDANHYLFLPPSQSEVVTRIREFLLR